MEMYDNENTVQKSFDTNFLPEESLQAQWAEFIELKKVINTLSTQLKRPIAILDIGIGNARIPKHLCGIEEIWAQVATYDGTDNAQPCTKIATEVIESLNIQDKVSVYLYDALHLSKWEKHYDLIITTWFTAGNFYPENFPFETYPTAGKRWDLTRNEKFEQIFLSAYQLLNPGGAIVIGACYIDNDRTRKKQEFFYNKMGMTVITDAADTFTATKEGFWSQRFTPSKLLSYFHFVAPKKINIIPLDTYDYAMQVHIMK